MPLADVVENHTGHEELQLKRVATVQRQVDDSSLIDDFNHRSLHQIDPRGSAFNRQFLRDLSKFHRDGDGQVLVDLK